MNSKVASAVLAAVMMASLPAAHAAREVGGVRFEDVMTLAEQPLVLNGVGMRVKMIIKVYAMGLYVPQRDGAAVSVLNQSGPKSVRIVMLRGVSAEQLSESLVEGVSDNASPAEQAALRSRLETLQATMLKMGQAPRGAVIQLDYLPGVGTRISLGGKVVGPDIVGEDFYRALLKIWLGDNPSDKALKRDLLGAA